MTTGRLGEQIAARFLADRGAVILERNLRVGPDEIDLLVRVDGERVAVEVKTARDQRSRPEENFDDLKVQKIRRAAGKLDPPVWRIDLITVVLSRDGATVRWLPAIG